MTKNKSLVITPDEIILNQIYYIRKQKVMIDKDLAILYNVKAIRLREQVKRNITKFPTHFMFQLTEQETEIMVSQKCDTIKKPLGWHFVICFHRTRSFNVSKCFKKRTGSTRKIEVEKIKNKIR